MDQLNGTHISSGNGHAEMTAQEERFQRAEEAVDRIAERVSHFVSAAGREILRLGERAREEAEDMWAEARMIHDHYQAARHP